MLTQVGELKIKEMLNNDDDVRSSLTNDWEEWNIVCSAMDVMEDTEQAIADFLSKREIESYLRLYGVLQAIYVQQDAVKKLYKVMNKHLENLDKDIKKFDISATSRLKKLRNITVGHPVSCDTLYDGTNASGYINRYSIRTGVLKVIIFNTDTEKDEHREYNLANLIDKYKKERKAIVEEIEEALN